MSQSVYRFGCHVLDLNRGLLLGPGGQELPLRPKSFDLLRVLVENAGRVVSRGELLDAIWPGLHINDDGITQCVREIRRALGDEAQQLIRTVAKRGYLLATYAMPPAAEPGLVSMEDVGAPPSTGAPERFQPDLSVVRAPRMSLVVLPFTSNDPEQGYLADAVTDDLTTDLSRLDGAFVIGRGSAQTYRGRVVDARRIGRELGVRYVVQGTVRRLTASTVLINAELVSTDSGASLWTDRFDQDLQDFAMGQGDIVQRLGHALGVRLIDVESERSVRERPDSPDAFDLVLRARSVRVFSIERARDQQALLQQALTLSPRSVEAMVQLAYCLMHQNDWLGQWDDRNTQQSLDLLQSAEALRPDALGVIALRGAMLLWQGRYAEGSEVYRRVLELDPNFGSAHHQIGAAKLWTGDPEGALVFYREALRRNPLGPTVFARFAVIGYALLLAKRPDEAVPWLRRALQEDPGRNEPSSSFIRAFLTSALELSGEHEQARKEATELARLKPRLTVRNWDMRQWERSPLGERLRYASEGLRLAGLRDVADEDADHGVPSTNDLHTAVVGLTPVDAPNVTTLRTNALESLLETERPLLVDVNALDWTLPGAVSVRFQMFGGTFVDAVQDQLMRKMAELTEGDIAQPIVVFGWNAERWAARNTALRIKALGYQHVYWYRGGKEVWAARGLPTEAARPLHL